MTEHTVVTRDEWLAARKQLLEEEQKHAGRSEELARKRRELPRVQVDKDYTFATDDGKKTLEDPPDWLEEWVRMVGTDLPTGLKDGPRWNAFALKNGVVYHTYTRPAPDRDLVVPYYQQLLDQTSKGRQEEFRACRHDEYSDSR